MRVLHLPVNIASQMSVTVRALREIGVEARGLAIGGHVRQSDTGVASYPTFAFRRHPLRRMAATARWWTAVVRAIRWADVIHWHFGCHALRWDLDLRLAQRLGKPGLVEFWGSDIRDPEIARLGNPYYARAESQWGDPPYESRKRSWQNQQRFGQRGFACLTPCPELAPYLRGDLFPEPIRTRSRVALAEYEPQYASARSPRPLVVHAPTAPLMKGTPAVLAAIEALKSRFDFEFRLLGNLPRHEALACLRNCDVLLDQFVVGDHGLISVESMALGKPVVCYLLPSVVAALPPECPIVNANQDNLAEVLAGLLSDGPRREQLGRQGRAYVEQYHDAHKIARQLCGVYERLIAAKGRAGCRQPRVTA